MLAVFPDHWTTGTAAHEEEGGQGGEKESRSDGSYHRVLPRDWFLSTPPPGPAGVALQPARQAHSGSPADAARGQRAGGTWHRRGGGSRASGLAFDQMELLLFGREGWASLAS